MKSFPVLLLLGIILSGCIRSANDHSEEGKNEDPDSLSASSARDYTFQKVYYTTLSDTAYSDTMYLRLHIDENTATGKYLWFIPQKDGKFGTITGTISHDTLYGYYDYQQEGGQYKDSVRIVLSGNQAIVTQYNAPGYQLIDTLRLAGK